MLHKNSNGSWMHAMPYEVTMRSTKHPTLLLRMIMPFEYVTLVYLRIRNCSREQEYGFKIDSKLQEESCVLALEK